MSQRQNPNTPRLQAEAEKTRKAKENYKNRNDKELDAPLDRITPESKTTNGFSTLPTRPKLVIIGIEYIKAVIDDSYHALLAQVKEANGRGAEVGLAIARSENNDHWSNELNKLIKLIEDKSGIKIKKHFIAVFDNDADEKLNTLDELYSTTVAENQNEKDITLQTELEKTLKNIHRATEGKNFLLDELRLRYQDYYGQLPTENECVFIEETPSICRNTVTTTNYRVAEARDENKVALQLGFHNDVICFFNGEVKQIPNELQNIKFSKFENSPLVHYVSLSQFHQALNKFEDDPGLRTKYLLNFVESSLNHFDSLPQEKQENLRTTGFSIIKNMVAALENSLIDLIDDSKSIKALAAVLSERQNDLRSKLNHLKVLDEKYSRHFGATYLQVHLTHLTHLLNDSIDDYKKLSTQDSTKLPVPNKMHVAESVLNSLPHITFGRKNANIPDKLKNEFTQDVSHSFNKKIDSIFKNISSIIIHSGETLKARSHIIGANNFKKKNENTHQNMLFAISSKINSISAPSAIVANEASLLQLKLQMQELAHYYASVKDTPFKPTKFDAVLNKILEIQNEIDKKLESAQQEQEEARVFLTSAQHYLEDNNLAKSTNGKKQLAIIKKASVTKDYVAAKHEFLEIYRHKPSKFFSSANSKTYFFHKTTANKKQMTDMQLSDKLSKIFNPMAGKK